MYKKDLCMEKTIQNLGEELCMKCAAFRIKVKISDTISCCISKI